MKRGTNDKMTETEGSSDSGGCRVEVNVRQEDWQRQETELITEKSKMDQSKLMQRQRADTSENQRKSDPGFELSAVWKKEKFI